MGRHRLPCDDPVLAAKRAKAREKMARMASRKRAEVEATAPRVNGAVVFQPVTCPRCGDVFRGRGPLHSYAVHRGSQCPWFDAAEKGAHDALVCERRNALIRQLQRLEVIEPLPRLHTGHELFERARAARRAVACWHVQYWDDLLSEGVLALLEDRDPREAMRAFMRSEGPRMLSLDGPAPWAPEHKLLDVLAA